jgi:hypothetical protein
MLRLLYRRSQLKGLLGGSRGWTVLWATLFGARLLRRLTRSKPEILYCEELQPGQALVLSLKDREPRVLSP